MEEINSILNSVKKYLGPDAEVTVFDPDLIMQINSAMATLEQLGIETAEPFFITDDTETWDDYFSQVITETDGYTTNITPLNKMWIKSYIYASVRIAFDPPSSSFALQALKEIRDELTWRISVMTTPINK